MDGGAVGRAMDGGAVGLAVGAVWLVLAVAYGVRTRYRRVGAAVTTAEREARGSGAEAGAQQRRLDWADGREDDDAPDEVPLAEYYYPGQWLHQRNSLLLQRRVAAVERSLCPAAAAASDEGPPKKAAAAEAAAAADCDSDGSDAFVEISEPSEVALLEEVSAESSIPVLAVPRAPGSAAAAGWALETHRDRRKQSDVAFKKEAHQTAERLEEAKPVTPTDEKGFSGTVVPIPMNEISQALMTTSTISAQRKRYYCVGDLIEASAHFGALYKVYLVNDLQSRSDTLRKHAQHSGQKFSLRILNQDQKLLFDIPASDTFIDLTKACPNVHPLVNVFEHFGYKLVFQPYCKGSTLFRYLQKNGPLPEPLAIDFCKQILTGVTALHSKGIVHGCLSLNTVIFTDSSRTQLELTCYGCRSAKAISQHLLDIILDETAMFIAPELCQFYNTHGACPIQPSADMWAVGCLAYALVTGKLPFTSDAPDVIQWDRAGLDFTRITAFGRSFIEQLLNTTPQKRFTASTALNHPWITSPPVSHSDSESV